MAKPQKRRVKLAGEFAWVGYCRMIAQGTRTESYAARRCLDIDGSTPTVARNKVEVAFTLGQIDDVERRSLVEALDMIEDMYDRGIQTHPIKWFDPEDWEEYGSGGHVRLPHLSSED